MESDAVTGLLQSAAAGLATGISRPADDDDFEAQMQDVDNMELVDRKIFAATILGVDIREVNSLERVAKVAKRYGLVTGSSMDLTAGYNFTKESDKQLAWKRVKDEAPFVLI